MTERASRIVIAGGSGFIGQSLLPSLGKQNYEIVILSRHKYAPDTPGVRWRHWDGRTAGDWAQELDGAKAVINLTGEAVNRYPTAANRHRIIASRVDSVTAVADAIRRSTHPPEVWVQAGAVGYYGNGGDQVCDENTPPGDTFLAEVSRQWESAFDNADTPATRRVLLRMGVVLGHGGGALPVLERLTRRFMGGHIGTGRQYMSWVHFSDMEHMISEMIRENTYSGVYNAVTPHPITNARFMHEMRYALRRPWSPPVPRWAIRVMSVLVRLNPELALTGQRCIPRRLVEQGFQFEFGELAAALENLYA